MVGLLFSWSKRWGLVTELGRNSGVGDGWLGQIPILETILVFELM